MNKLYYSIGFHCVNIILQKLTQHPASIRTFFLLFPWLNILVEVKVGFPILDDDIAKKEAWFKLKNDKITPKL